MQISPHTLDGQWGDERIAANGGTLAYIAALQAANRGALAESRAALTEEGK
jgi:hypothetical protein